ncbi:hypothetical protein [Rhodococcus oxybenzonivorans]|uniref:hypothetical protein n=1 Tax=Rhodococcus oxybenzonivorans TaxID=1990687 RepID=UPI0013A5A9C8|nr:hypothetical protein [Rhodococcus oxybenzonivorans]
MGTTPIADPRSGQNETRERPDMLAYVRACLRASKVEEVRIPTTAVDQVLDELSSLE